MYSLPTLSSLYPKLKKTWMKRFPTRSLTYWCISAVEATNKNQEDCPEDNIHLRRQAWDDIVTSHGYRATVHISTGAIPLLPSVYNMEVVLPIEVEVPSIGVLPKSKLDWAQNIWRPCTTTKRGWNKTSNKRVRPHEIQEKDFVPKKVLSLQPYTNGKWTPGYEGPCAMTFTTVDSGKLARPMKADAVKKYFVKNKKLDKSQIWKGDLGKNERLGGLKTRKGGPGKN